MGVGKITIVLCAIVLVPLACGSSGEHKDQLLRDVKEEFKDYWMSGTAELSSYDLEQARYGEIHEGDAVLIFVTEDFSRSKQVKLDRVTNEEDAAKVLKLNYTKKFNTGIYPYSIMNSVFTDVREYRLKSKNIKKPITYKSSTSVQEWCGHVFTQINLKDTRFNIATYSYFESEGDYEFMIPATYLEDELMNIIRLDPNMLPIGRISFIPGVVSRRLLHRPIEPSTAVTKILDEEDYKIYEIVYENEERWLKIKFGTDFPHKILGWEEKYVSGWGESAKELTTKATLRKSINVDYWAKNSVSDTLYRKELGLD